VRGLQSSAGTLFRWVLTFLSVCLGYIVFRTLSFHATGIYLRGMVVPWDGEPLKLRDLGLFLTILAVVVAHAVSAKGWWQRWWDRQPAAVLGLGYSLSLSLA